MLTLKLFQGSFNMFSLKYYLFFTLNKSFAVKTYKNTLGKEGKSTKLKFCSKQKSILFFRKITKQED